MNNPFRRAKAELRQAEQAVEQAKKDLQKTRAATPRFVAIGREARQIMEDNGLGAALHHSFRGEAS